MLAMDLITTGIKEYKNMKFDCGLTWEDELKKLKEWHDFFTILPRRVCSNDCRMLETIERKGKVYVNPTSYGPAYKIKWTYRAKDK